MKRTLFDHDNTPILAPMPGDNLSLPITGPYSDRALALSSPQDVVMLHPEDYPHAQWMIRHQQRVGLKPATLILRKMAYNMVTNFPEYRLSTFIFNDDAHRARPDKERLAITKSMDSKNDFIQLCEALCIPVAKTWRYDSKNQLTDLGHLEFPCFMKISTSLAGRGVFRCEDKQQLTACLDKISPEIKFQIQEDMVSKHRAITFLNLQYYEEDGRAMPLLLTDQVLDGNVHVGNRHSTEIAAKYAKAWETTHPLAHYAAKFGIKGIFAYDVAVCQDENSNIYYLPVECNPRPNGSSYATAVADKLLGKNTPWTSKSVKTRHRSLNDIDLGDLEFSAKRGNGVVVHIGSTIGQGKLGVTFLGPPPVQRELETKLTALLQ
ncbi:hypothetical protein HGA34_04500 [Candidatus Falkowbacteria bacterium]|nr:hypothetical protein [Candidatus Falkowbacteria bacterium]